MNINLNDLIKGEPIFTCKIYGQPVSLKNGRQLTYRFGKPVFIKSREAQEYCNSFSHQITEDMKLGLGSSAQHLALVTTLYYSTYRPDVSCDIVKDMLQNTGVITNDRWIRVEFVDGRVDKRCPRALIALYALPTEHKRKALIEE